MQMSFNISSFFFLKKSYKSIIYSQRPFKSDWIQKLKSI